MRISIIGVGLALLLGSTAVLAQPVIVKLGHFATSTESIFAKVITPWAATVNSEAKGTIKIELFPNGALGRNLVQQAQLVDNGVEDIGFVVPGVTPGRFSDNVVLTLPGLFKDIREATMVTSRLVTQGKLRGYEKYFVIDEFATPPFSIHLRKSIKNLGDLKGLKIRAGNSIEASMLKEVGAVPVLIPVNEIPEAIGRGTIDGTTAQPQTVFDFGIDRVTSFHYMVRLGTAPLAELMNRQKFESLPQQGRDAIRRYSGEWFAKKYLSELSPLEDEYVKRLKNDPKHTVVYPSAEDEKKWDAAAQRVIAAWEAKDPRNGQLLQLVHTEIAKVRAEK